MRRHRALRATFLLALTCALPLGAPARASEELPTVTYSIEGLASAVEILVDRWGVAHIYASSQDDLFFAQGFNAARDRLWQLDIWKRRGDGTLAEVLGPAYVEKDRAARLLLFRGDMHAEWLAYASDTKRITSAFVDGVNAFVGLTRSRPELLPPEFEILGYRPAHWTPETVVRIRSHGLLRNAESELARALFLRLHGVEALAFRDHLEPSHTVQVPEGLDLSLLDDEVLRVYRLGTGGIEFDAAVDTDSGAGLAEGSAALLAAAGSNNWAIAAKRTATGRPILANDPHRLQALPSLRYIVHLSSPDLDIIGAGEPALPGISIGHNGRVAFGLTIFSIDQEDLYVYETRPDAPDEYRYLDRWTPMTVVREQIAVRDGEPIEVELRFTRHGPILWQDEARGVAVGLRAAWLEPGMAPYLGSIEYMRARSWDEFLAAMNRWGAPSENQVYADVSGIIGWKPGGLAPIRPNWDGLLPVPGDGRYEWAGFRDMDELPAEQDPERGWVATANQMNLPAGYPHPLGYEWRPPYRFLRIGEVLAASERHTLQDSLALQADVLSIPARRLLAVLAELLPADRPLEAFPRERRRQLRRALELLRAWDARLEPRSAAAALFEVWAAHHLGRAVLADLVGGAVSEEVLSALGRGDTEIVLRLLEDARAGDQAERARHALLSSLLEAISETESHLGKEWSRWEWGNLHQIELHHPLAGKLPDLLTDAERLGPLPRGGSGDTVGNTAYDRHFRQVAGASFRMVVDVGSWDESLAMNSPGQSGDPRSPHFSDLFPLWGRDGAFPLLYSRVGVTAAAERRIVLEPAVPAAP